MDCACPTCGQTLPADDTLRIDPAGIVVRGRRFATLSPQEATVLAELVKARGGLRTKERLLSSLHLFGAEDRETKIIDVHVCRLRRKLKPLGLSIGTVWGQGYRLITGREASAA